MKLSKTSRLVLAIGVFVVVFASLGITQTQQSSQQDKLSTELALVEKRLNNIQLKELQNQQETLQRQLDERAVQLTAAKGKLRQPIANISAYDDFFAIAENCSVEVINVRASDVGTGMLDNIDCATISLSASVKADVTTLIRFIDKLNKDFTTGIVQSTQISGVSENESSAGINMIIYAYKGE